MKEEAPIRRNGRAKAVPSSNHPAALRRRDREIRDQMDAQVIPLLPRATEAAGSVVGSNDPESRRVRPWPSAERAQELAARGRRFLMETKSAESGTTSTRPDDRAHAVPQLKFQRAPAASFRSTGRAHL